MYQEFINTHPVFKGQYSRLLCQSIIDTLMGLGLPLPVKQSKCPWGYRKEGSIFVPNEQELEVLATAFDMDASGMYFLDDVIAWLQAALPNAATSRRTYLILKKERPLFPEFRYSLEERIKIAHAITTAARTEKV